MTYTDAIKERLEAYPRKPPFKYEEFTLYSGEGDIFECSACGQADETRLLSNNGEYIVAEIPGVSEVAKASGEFLAHAPADVRNLLEHNRLLTEALEKARHDMVTTSGLVATDVPGLCDAYMQESPELHWKIEHPALKAVDEALTWTPEVTHA